MSATPFVIERTYDAPVEKVWKAITDKAEHIYALLPEEYRDAFFQLELYPTKASAQVAQLYVPTGNNQLYVSQKRASANVVAQQATALCWSETPRLWAKIAFHCLLPILPIAVFAISL